MNKVAQNTDEASKLEEKYTGLPHGWIQWKGTEVCMDVLCKCGCMSHIDDSFTYYVRCPKCGTVYECNGHIELIELIEHPTTHISEPEDDDDVDW